MLGETWTAVCGNNFSSSDAKVICRQLGYPSNAALPLLGVSFGPRQEKGVLLVDYRCTGNESTILDCSQNVKGRNEPCNAEEFSVFCSNSSTHLYVLVETNKTDLAYPLAEGTAVTLQYKNVQLHQSAVSYTWPETAGGLSFGEYLVFKNVSRAQHGRRVRCAATYNHSASVQLVSSEPLVLQVYYNPSVKATSGVETCQPRMSDFNLCVVTQNQNLTLVCEADSNPPPVSITWSGKINSTGPILHIMSADPTTHDGLYICTVNNTPADGDRRLSFVSSYRFSVIVQCNVFRHYLGTILTLNVNAIVDHRKTYMGR